MDLLSSFLHYTYLFFKTILMICITILSTFIAFKLYKIIYIKVNEKKEINRFKRGVLLPTDLFQLTDLEFKDWCSKLLKRLDYSDVELCTQNNISYSNKDIACKKDNITFYIDCKRYTYKKNSKESVTVNDIKHLLGAMISDKVTNGIIITTGFLSKEASTYLATIPTNYNIEIIQGNDLIEKYKISNYGYLLMSSTFAVKS